MDPLTQGVLGASLPQATQPARYALSAGVLGWLAGMAPDLDVLIRSSNDPLLFLEYHRHFTHALIFIPLGGFICGLVLHALIGRRFGLSLKRSWLFCTLGYGTHAVLDACTTYGTLLLWPFSDVRIAWNTVSVIDPLFTLPMLVLVIMAALKRRPLFACIALVWGASYLGLGVLQRDAATSLGMDLARQRGHEPVRLEAKPSFANILVWKVVYEAKGRFYVDAIRTGFAPKVFVGDSVLKLDVKRDLPWLDPASQQARDIERFRWFSNDYLAIDPRNPLQIGDIRYSLIPSQVAPLWSISLSPTAAPDQHVAYVTTRNPDSGQTDLLLAMLRGEGGSTPQRFLGGG
ncbi:MAG: metal-dependent hydrolase [Halioglobus sp.]